MNEAECVLAIANGLCQAFRDLATAVLNAGMHAIISSPRSLANFTRPSLENVNRKEGREAIVVTQVATAVLINYTLKFLLLRF